MIQNFLKNNEEVNAKGIILHGGYILRANFELNE